MMTRAVVSLVLSADNLIERIVAKLSENLPQNINTNSISSLIILRKQNIKRIFLLLILINCIASEYFVETKT